MKTLLNDSINTKEINGDIENNLSIENDNLDPNTITETLNNGVVNIGTQKQKFSSSMKFYLLKKKFMKQNNICNVCLENELTYEDYLIT
jgi:hypothetical protein